MKRVISVLLLFILVLENGLYVNAAEQAVADTYDEEELILQYYQCINSRNVDEYISLFTADQRTLMQKHLLRYGEEDFFRNETVDAVNIKILTDETGYLANAVNYLEMKSYGTLECVYVEQETIKGNDETTISYVCFVLAEENDSWKIERVSVPNMQYIFQNNEQFGSVYEQAMEMKQETQMNLVTNGRSELQNGSMLAASSLTAPTSITVYFTKEDNINYHGTTKESLDFSTYLKNTIGEEWTVANYENYPTYLQAGVMASKMYAWYNTVNPKRNYAPYYACVLDNTSDQNYWCYSASNVEKQGAKYLRYLESALSYANGLALVTEDTESIFETQYRTSSGNIHSGILNQQGALELAKNGYSCLQILQEYYGSAPGISGDYVKIVTHQ